MSASKPERVERDTGRYYKIDGNAYPSVTNVLDSYEPKAKAIREWKARTDDWEHVRDRSAIVGTLVHHRVLNPIAMRELPLPEIDMSMVDESVQTDVETGVSLWRRCDFDVGDSPYVEEPVHNPDPGYAGTFDLMTGGTVVDLKTSASAYDSHKMQIAAYWQACRKLPRLPDPTDAAIIVLNPDTDSNPSLTPAVHRLSERDLRDWYEKFEAVCRKFHD